MFSSHVPVSVGGVRGLPELVGWGDFLLFLGVLCCGGDLGRVYWVGVGTFLSVQLVIGLV